MKKLSIILPIYNVENYLEKCIRSLEEQDIPKEEYEIICVNDGSPDNSRDVVLKLQQEFNNIILFDQENQGVSMARNRGIDEAKGKYLLFVDPDDFIIENRLGKILLEVDEKNIQMAIFSYVFVDSNGNEENERKFYDSNILTGIEAYYLSRRKKGITVDSSVGILFNRIFLNKNALRYLRGVILNQDVEFLARAHCIAERCILINEVLYVAVNRIGSATRSNQSATNKVRNGFILAANNIKKFQQAKLLNKEQMVFLNGPIVKFVLLAISSATRSFSLKVFIDTSSSLYKLNFKRLDVKGCSRYNRICGIAYNISPYIGAFVMVIYQHINRMHNKS